MTASIQENRDQSLGGLLLAVAERCEAAAGPDRGLDAIVAATLRIGTDHLWAGGYPAWEGRADGRVYLERGGPSFEAARYTASLDAAMTLAVQGISAADVLRHAINRCSRQGCPTFIEALPRFVAGEWLRARAGQ